MTYEPDLVRPKKTDYVIQCKPFQQRRTPSERFIFTHSAYYRLSSVPSYISLLDFQSMISDNDYLSSRPYYP